jgi:hypothetical protein
VRRACRACVAAAVPLTLTLALVAPERAWAADSTTNVCTEPAPKESAPSAGGVAGAPLTVTGGSHVVVMEYEAWFGPATGVSPQPNITTCLQSTDMTALGGGYDSADPAVIAQHVKWLEQMGLDAVTADLTNNVSCIFDGDNAAIIRQACPNASFRTAQLHIRDNNGNLYPAWAALHTRLKIAPLLGGFDQYAVTPDAEDSRHRTSLEKEIDYFGGLMTRFPDLNVVYEDKPLMLIYLGTPIVPGRVQAIAHLLKASGVDRRYSFRLVGGYLDSQPSFWANPGATPDGPIEIAPKYDFWSVVDRLNFWGAPPAPYYPTFNKAGARIENMTASLATAGQNGWNCATKGISYCPDAALRYCGEGFQNGCKPGDYETLAEFMGYARSLQPIFLILDQFNEFAMPDEGWNAETNDDTEPTRQWGYSGIRAVTAAIAAYRGAATTDPSGIAR